MSRANLVIVGAGLMGTWHARFAQAIGARLSAVIDPDPVRADRLLRTAPASSFRTLADFTPPRGSIVHIAAPPSAHADALRWSIAHGCHALCEKPFLDDPAETRTILSAARAARVLVAPVHQFGFQPTFLTWDSTPPALGRLIHADFQIASAGAEHAPQEFRARFLDEVAPHPLSLLHRVLGIPVASLDWKLVSQVAGEWHLTATSGSTLLTVGISTHARPPECRMTLRGDHATLRADLFHGFAVLDPGTTGRAAKMWMPFGASGRTAWRAARNLWARSLRGEGAYPGLKELILRFHSAALAGGDSPISEAETLAVADARALWRELCASTVRLPGAPGR